MIQEWLDTATTGDYILMFTSVFTVSVCIALGIGEIIDKYNDDDWLNGKRF